MEIFVIIHPHASARMIYFPTATSKTQHLTPISECLQRQSALRFITIKPFDICASTSEIVTFPTATRYLFISSLVHLIAMGAAKKATIP